MTTASSTAPGPDVRADELVVEGETRFRIMADSAPVALWMTGTDAKCDFFNQTWLDMTVAGDADERLTERGVGAGEGLDDERVQRRRQVPARRTHPLADAKRNRNGWRGHILLQARDRGVNVLA